MPGLGSETAARRLYAFNWITIGILAVVLGFGLSLSGFAVEPRSALVPVAAVAIFAAAAFLSLRLGRGPGRAFWAFGGAAQIIVVTALGTPLTYVAATAALPLQDANLALADRMLGLDWVAYVRFVDRSPLLTSLAAVGYTMISGPLLALPLLLGHGRHNAHLNRFTLALLLTLVAVTTMSILVPALGAYQHFGMTPADHPHIAPVGYLDTLRDLPRVRDGSLRTLDLVNLVGIITFPSFHAAAAVLYLWGYWPVWWMRLPAIVANGVMLVATPIGGGHYFVDILAGVAIAVVGIMAASRIARRLTGRMPQPGPLATQPVAVGGLAAKSA